MALSFKEKRALTKMVNAKVEEINAGGLSFKEKRVATKALNDAVAKLTSENISGNSSTLDKLLAGEFDDLSPVKFLGELEKAVNELNGDIEPVKEPVINYISNNADKIDMITESAIKGTILESATGPMVQNNTSMSQDYAAVRKISDNEFIIDIDHGFYEPQTFRRGIFLLESLKEGDEVTLKLNSNGGMTVTAQAMYVALLETKARTKAKIINAASSGSIVAMACDEIIPTPFCSMMIHSASGGVHGKMGDMANQANYHKEFFNEWFTELYSGFLTSEEINDVSKGWEIWLKENEIKERLKNWIPIRTRKMADQEGLNG